MLSGMDLSVAVVQQLQEYEIEVFGNNAGTTPLLAALGLPTFGFGFPNPPPLSELPTFTSQAVSTSLTSTPFFNGPERSDSVALNTNFVFGAVRQEQPVARAAMDHSMDSSWCFGWLCVCQMPVYNSLWSLQTVCQHILMRKFYLSHLGIGQLCSFYTARYLCFLVHGNWWMIFLAVAWSVAGMEITFSLPIS